MDLSEAIRHWGLYYKNNIALSGNYQVTYKELNNYINNVSRVINSSIGSQKTIAILTNKGLMFIVFLVSIMRTNNKFILLNPNLSCEQIEKIIRMSDCEAVLVSEKKYDINIAQIKLEYDEIINCTNTREFYPSCYFSTTEVVGTLFTSGTTGFPKGVARTNYSFLSEAILWIIELELTRRSSVLVPRVLYNTSGFVLMYSTLFIGARLDLFDSPKTIQILEYLNCHECEWTFLVPSVLREIMAYYQNYNKMSHKVLVMGEPISADEKLQFAKRFKCNIIEAWGNSEGLGTITSPDDILIRPTSVGHPFFTDRIEILDSDNNFLHDKSPGIICGYSDNEFQEYLNNKKLTNSTKHENLILSSDIGEKDCDGYLYVFARNDDVIMVNGLNVYPVDIEDIIRKNSKVSDCIVIGLVDEIKNSKIIAVIEARDVIEEDDLLESINCKLAPHEYIYKIIMVEHLPRNEGGKVIRNEVIKIVQKKFGR